MINIRRGSFETNSSSSHALVYAPNSYKDALHFISTNLDYFIRNGVFYLGRYEGLYYGRSPFKILYTFVDKVRYAYANFIYCSEREEELLKIVQKLYPQVERFSVFMGPREESEYNEWVANGKPEDEYGYVEHVSIGTDEPYLESWMDKYNFTLEKFLTDPHYVVIVDGDEYCIWHDMKNLGIITDFVDMKDRKESVNEDKCE